MKILVTGGAGFIGSHIVEYLVQRGDDVTILDNLNTGKVENLSKVKNDINFVNGDIREYKLLEGLVSDSDGVFHEAALASVQQSLKMQDEYFDVNVSGTENILKLAKEYGFKVVYASSSSVYGMGVKVVGLRYFNVFGKRQSKEYAGVIKLFLDRIQQNKPPKINGDGLQTRDFVYIDDVVKANILAMDSNINYKFLNVGSGLPISILDLANEKFEIINRRFKFVFFSLERIF